MMIFSRAVVTVCLATCCVIPVTAGEPEFVDRLIDERLEKEEINPSATCSDSEFLRRVSLDLIGRIPTEEELSNFLANPDRSAKVDELLKSDRFSRFFSEIWTASLIGYLNGYGGDREALRIWLEDQFRADRGFDDIASELITAKGNASLEGPVNFLVRNRDDPVVKVGRMFLGVRLDCAQCHDHPFDRWTQNDYQQMRRFFAQIQTDYRNGSALVYDNVRETDENSRPVFLTGARTRTNYWRGELALFVTHSKPFARTFANRIWYHLMGRGIVHPVDDLNQENRAVMPELLEQLAEYAKANDFSTQAMIRLICNSKAYQRSSNRESSKGEKLFAYRVIKPMTPGQYIESLSIALDTSFSTQQRTRLLRRMLGDVLQEDYSPTWDYRETIQMAMSRMAIELPSVDLSTEKLYRRVLSRDPTKSELEICRGKSKQDILFALIHSNEFYFNH